MAESRTFSTPSIVHVRPSVTALRRTQRNNGAITICGQLDAPNRERGLVTYGMPQLHGLGNAENTPAGFGQGRPLDRLVCIISIHGVQYKRWQRFDVRFSKVVVGEHAIWGSSAWHGRNSNDLERNSLWITNGGWFQLPPQPLQGTRPDTSGSAANRYFFSLGESGMDQPQPSLQGNSDQFITNQHKLVSSEP